MGTDQFEPGRRVRNQEYGEGEILGKCKHENSWDVQFDNFPFWLCAHESNLELLPIEPEQADGSMAETLAPTPAAFTRGQRIEYLEDSAWLPGVYIEPSHVEGFPHAIKCDSGKTLCAAEGSIRAADSIPLVPDATYLAPPPDPTPTPATYKWGQLVIVDGGTDNAREGIVICDQPSQTDRSWFVSTPPCCNQWIRADRLTAFESGKVEATKVEPPAPQEQGETPIAHGYEGYGWIKVKKFDPEKYATIEERYTALDMHHVQETSFLIDKVRELATKVADSSLSLGGQALQLFEKQKVIDLYAQQIAKIAANSPSLGGQTVPLAEHQSVVDLYERQIAKMTDSSQILSELRSRLHVLSEESNEAARYAHSCPGHTQSTLKTLAFRLDCLARGVVG